MKLSPGRDLALSSPLGRLEECEPEEVSAEADAGGGFTTPRKSKAFEEGDLAPQMPRTNSVPAGLAEKRACSPRSPLGGGGEKGAWNLSMHSTTRSLRSTMCSSSPDPYLYANGCPVIKNRRQHMSVDQLMSFCKELKIVPDLLSRLQVVKIFKRAQVAGSNGTGAGSSYGYLTLEAFVDAAGQLAIEAYSAEPYCDEFPAAHEKVHAFFLRILPTNSKEAHERFRFGCTSR